MVGVALIDLTIERPALKRTEVVAATDDVPETEAGETVVRVGDREDAERADETSAGTGKFRRTAATAGLVAAGVVGLHTLRKVRNRRSDE